ncbi:MAG: hypothetical protein COV70_03035 [Parcubacteria group bacterium CG11_big_fil_rev_8_21_14_0_20_39_22]|nr:MAG: hypothetical protein COV70_03035 [Parcubacteria group bacterium CG11_big_fil_rev_8_21_14_0_20_39_22]
MELLGKLFGSEARVKIMRLFLFNPKRAYAVADIAERAKVPSSVVRKECTVLRNAKLIEPKSFVRAIEQKRGKKTVVKKKRESGFTLNENFPYLEQMQNLLIYTVLVKNDSVVRRLRDTCKLKLVVVSGVFIKDWDSRVDLLVVGDKIKAKPLENVIKTLEAEIGKELRYSAFETEDFQYRYGMYDKLIRDVLDYPHTTIYNKLGLVEEKR